MEYYKLIDVMTTPVNASVLTKRKGGGTVYGRVRLEPGMAYEMPLNDPDFRKTIMAVKAEAEMGFERILKKDGIKYEIIRPSCHCRKPFLKFNCVEVFEGESD